MIADEQGFVSLTFYKIELGLTVYPNVVVNELEKKEFNLGLYLAICTRKLNCVLCYY